MKKILFFIDKVSASGASKIISWLVNNLQLENVEITLASYITSDTRWTIADSVKRVLLTVNQENKIKRGTSVVYQLRSLIRKNRYSVCVGFLPTECLYLQLATVGLKTKVIVCERSDPFLERSKIADLGRFVYRFADGAVFQTENAKAYFPHSLQNKSAVIPNPAFKLNIIGPDYYKREKHVSNSGRLYINQKRQDVLLKAFKIVTDYDEDVILDIYGDGPDKDKLISLSSELKLGERVKFWGNVNNVEERISSSRLFVLTSDYEGIPNVIIEALQCGVPVVSTNCSPGGAELLIQNEKNGFIVPREDYKELAEKILFMLSNVDIAKKMSERAPKVVEDFSENKIIVMWENYLNRFLGSDKYGK